MAKSNRISRRGNRQGKETAERALERVVGLLARVARGRGVARELERRYL